MSHGLTKIILRLNENIHTTVAHNAHCRKVARQHLAANHSPAESVMILPGIS